MPGILLQRSLAGLGIALALSWATEAQAQRLSAGPMLGDTTESSTQIWLQTEQATRAHIEYWPEKQPQQRQKSPVIVTSAERFLTGLIPVTGLKAGQRYNYTLFLNDQPVERPYPLSFSTAPVYRSGMRQPPEVKMLLGSCYYLNDPLMDVLNIPYGDGLEIFESMARHDDQMMLWLGDNVYFAPFDLSNLYNMNRRYARHRQLPQLQPLLAKMSHYATWDDHDFGPNNSDRHFIRAKESLALFKAYWTNPRYGLLSTPGIFFQKRWGDVEILMTDNRFHRDGNTFSDPLRRQYLGPDQMAWLKNALKASTATFKLVVVATPVLNQNYIESFALATGEYQNLMNFIAQEKIEGVVFISGDRHHSDLMKLERPGAYPLYNYTSSPLTSEPTRLLSEAEARDSRRVPGSLLRQRNYGRLHVHGPENARVLELEAYDTAGKKIWNYSIPASRLRYPDRGG